MQKKYYFMHLDAVEDNIPNSRIQDTLDPIANWARLRGGSFYLLYSDRSAKEIRDLVQPVLNTGDHLLVGEFAKGNHSGWISTVTVEWLKKERD